MFGCPKGAVHHNQRLIFEIASPSGPLQARPYPYHHCESVASVSPSPCPFVLESHLFGFIDHVLHNALNSFKGRTHVRARPDWSNSIVEARLFVRVGEESVANGLSALALSFLFELDMERKNPRVRRKKYPCVIKKVSPLVSKTPGEKKTYHGESVNSSIHEISLVVRRRGGSAGRSRCG